MDIIKKGTEIQLEWKLKFPDGNPVPLSSDFYECEVTYFTSRGITRANDAQWAIYGDTIRLTLTTNDQWADGNYGIAVSISLYGEQRAHLKYPCAFGLRKMGTAESFHRVQIESVCPFLDYLQITRLLTHGTAIAAIRQRDGHDEILYAPTGGGGGGGGNDVEWEQLVTTGVRIATIKIDGVETDVYAPYGGSEVGPIETVTASVDANVGTPYAVATYNALARSLDLAFHNLKGTPGRNGTNGTDGDPGDSFEKLEFWHLATREILPVPSKGTSGWLKNNTPSNYGENYPYLWRYEKVTKSDGTSTETDVYLFAHWGIDGESGFDGDMYQEVYALVNSVLPISAVVNNNSPQQVDSYLPTITFSFSDSSNLTVQTVASRPSITADHRFLYGTKRRKHSGVWGIYDPPYLVDNWTVSSLDAAEIARMEADIQAALGADISAAVLRILALEDALNDPQTGIFTKLSDDEETLQGLVVKTNYVDDTQGFRSFARAIIDAEESQIKLWAGSEFNGILSDAGIDINGIAATVTGWADFVDTDGTLNAVLARISAAEASIRLSAEKTYVDGRFNGVEFDMQAGDEAAIRQSVTKARYLIETENGTDYLVDTKGHHLFCQRHAPLTVSDRLYHNNGHYYTDATYETEYTGSAVVDEAVYPDHSAVGISIVESMSFIRTEAGRVIIRSMDPNDAATILLMANDNDLGSLIELDASKIQLNGGVSAQSIGVTNCAIVSCSINTCNISQATISNCTITNEIHSANYSAVNKTGFRLDAAGAGGEFAIYGRDSNNNVVEITHNGIIIPAAVITGLNSVTILSSQIQAGTITGDKLAANTISADKINADNLQILAGNVVGTLSAANINTDRLVVGSMAITGLQLERATITGEIMCDDWWSYGTWSSLSRNGICCGWSSGAYNEPAVRIDAGGFTMVTSYEPNATTYKIGLMHGFSVQRVFSGSQGLNSLYAKYDIDYEDTIIRNEYYDPSSPQSSGPDHVVMITSRDVFIDNNRVVDGPDKIHIVIGAPPANPDPNTLYIEV